MYTKQFAYEKASFARRAVAYVIDLLIYGVLLTVSIFLFAKLLNADVSWAAFKKADTRNALRPLIYIDYFISIGYFVYLQMRTNGQTLGKKWLGLRVITIDGSPLTTRTLFLRENVCKLVSAVLVFIGFLMALGGSKHALHDRFTKTMVVRDQN